MDRSWIFGAPFTPTYVKGVEEFMKFVSDRYPKDSQILCPYTRRLNQILRSQPDVSDHLHIYGMSATYTRWIYHGESADVEVVENLDQQQLDGRDYDFGIHMDAADDDYDEDHGVPELIGELYTAAEAQGEQPRFARVLEDAKKSLSPGSSHSKFFFLVRMLYIKSRYRIGNGAFSVIMKLLSGGYLRVICQNHMMRPRNILKSWALVFRTLMCARIIVCCFERSMKRRMCAQYARRLDGKMELGPSGFHTKY
jgi:hypothetical protein